MASKWLQNGVINIQAADYNGACTAIVLYFTYNYCTLFALHIDKYHEDIVTQKSQGAPRKGKLFFKTPRRKKRDYLTSPNSPKEKRLRYWKLSGFLGQEP